jgi:putative peptidoglycan lipid II flippase
MKTTLWQKIATRWQSVSTGSVNSKIFSAAIIVAGGTLFVKLIAVVKELVVAWKFGTADELDAFLIALMIPSLLIAVIAGSFNAALIPTYIKVRDHEGKAIAQKLFSSATVWSIGLLAIVTCLIIVTAPLYLPSITSGFAPKKLELTYHLLWIVSPMIILSGVGTIWGAVLNAGERFALVALTPILTSGATILLLLINQSGGIFNLAIGMIVGQLLEMGVVGHTLRKQGISLMPKWYGFDPNLREVASQYAPTIAGSFLMCSTGLVDQSMAATLPSGSVAALAYGNRIIALPIVIATTALSTAVIPYFSKMVALDDWKSIRQSLKQYLGLIFAASVPLTAFIILLSEPIVRILFQRGSFTAENSHLVAQIQACFALQIPFYIGCILVVRLHSAMRNNQMMMWGSAGNLIVNIGLNYLFMQWLGVVGIALSTSCVYLFSFLFLLFFLVRNLKAVDALGLTIDQKEKIEQLQESKFKSINTVLTREQHQALQQMQAQRTSTPQGINGVNLSADQKNELRTIRQAHIQQLKLILTSEQTAKLERIGGSDKGISILFLRSFSNRQMAKMDFSSDQKQKIKELLIADRQQIDNVLTKEQQQKTIAIQSRNRAVNQGWKKLNLTASQKAEMKAIRDAKKQELNSILTPEQQAKIKTGKGKYKIE